MSYHLPSIRKRKKRVARGGKRGTTAGRGTKGQRSRSGHVIRPAERDIILKLPKQRGFRNKTKSAKPVVFNLKVLAEKLHSRSAHGPVTLNMTALKEAGLLKSKHNGEVKLLGTGEIAFPVNVGGDIIVSKSAAKKIKAAGGSVSSK